MDRDLIRGNKKTKASASSLTFATWNVEDLTDEKIVSLQESMIALNIQVLCIQETRRSLSDYWITDKGFLVILSGRSDEKREFAGVGFIIAPQLRASIIGFCQASSRFACVKLKVAGEKIVIVLTYVP